MKMTGRQRIEQSFSDAGTDAPAAVLCYEGIYYRDRWDEVTGLPWWYAVSPDIAQQTAATMRAVRATGQAWFAVGECAPLRDRQRQRIRLQADGVYLVTDGTDAPRRLDRPVVGGWSPAGGVHSHHPETPPDTPEAVAARLPPPLPFDRDRFLAEGRADAARTLIAELGADRVPIAHTTSPLWNCYSLWGFEGIMTRILDAPDLVEYAIKRFLNHSLRRVAVAAACGAEMIWIEECLTDMISPHWFQRLNMPALRALVDAIRSLGLRGIYYYCGNPAGKWDMLLATGADALALEEGKKGFTIDIAEAAVRAAGRCVLLGNLDAVAVLQNGTDAQLVSEIERQWRAGRDCGGRFILSIGSPVTPATPVARVRRYTDAVHAMAT